MILKDMIGNNELILSCCVMLFLAYLVRCLCSIGKPVPSTPVSKPMECPDKDNLQGLCLRREGCKTSSDCRYMVREQDYRQCD